MGCGSSSASQEAVPPAADIPKKEPVAKLRLAPLAPADVPGRGGAPAADASSSAGSATPSSSRQRAEVLSPTSPPTVPPRDVESWLKSIRMDEYCGHFKQAGIDDLLTVAKMSPDDMERAGVVKVGHKKKMQKQCVLLSELLRRSAMLSATPAAPVPPGQIELDAADMGALAPRTFLRSHEPVPPGIRSFSCQGNRVRLHKHVHEANAPCEDRHTVVSGDGFVFAGVWDGHTGHYASEFAEEQVFVNLQRAVRHTAGPDDGDGRRGQNDWAEAFRTAYRATDQSYHQTTKVKVKRKEMKAISLFAGTCAVGAHVDLQTRRVSVANLGDSRAVIGLYEPTGLRTVIMSHDQTATDDAERSRLRKEHRGDASILLDKGDKERPDWRVKGITQFTRSIGDLQMKDKAVAVLYNTYTKGCLVQPVPGQRIKGLPTAKPYIIERPEFKDQTIDRGFLILASDGLWDELTNEEAVQAVAMLLRSHPEPDADIAAMLVERALLAAAHRIAADNPAVAQEVFADPSNPTVDELRQLPQGKKTPTHRSNLHDDITCVIIVLRSEEDELEERMTSPAMQPEKKKTGRKRRKSEIATQFRLVDEEDEEARAKHDTQILEIIDVASSFTADQLRILFDALDVDPKNDRLSQHECHKLCNAVLSEEGNHELVDMVFQQMDRDNTGDVSWENFLNFFNVAEDSGAGSLGRDRESTASVQGFQKIYSLLDEIPVFEGLSLAEREDLARVLTKMHFKDGEEIITQGDEGDCMYIVDNGSAYAEINGKKVMEYSEQQYFGELALRAKQPRAATVKAGGDTTLLRLGRDEFQWLVVEKKGIRSLLESRTKRQSRESFDELPSLDATTEAAIDEALTSSNPGEGFH